MKKMIAAAALFCGLLVLLTACGRSSAARRVDNMIKDLDKISLESGSALEKIRDAYDALSDTEKAEVRRLEKLEKAEETYNNYVQINREIAGMLEISDGSFSDAELGISYLLERADAILKEYRKMSAFEKSQIKDADRIKEAAEILKSYVDNAKTPAAAYVKAFRTLHADASVTGVFCVKNLRGGEEYHYFALTYEDAEGKSHSVYSTARVTVQISADAIAARPDIFFADAPVTADTDAVTNGNVTLDTEEILSLAE